MPEPYKEICDLLVKAESFQEVLEGFYSFLETPFVLINENYQIFASCSPTLTDDPVWNEGIQKGYWQLDFIAKVQNRLKNMDEKAICDEFSNHRRLFICLKKDEVRIGYIVFLELGKRLEELDNNLLQMLTALVRKYILSAYESKEDQIMSTDILFSGLVNGSFRNRRIFLEKARILSIDQEKEYRLMIVRSADAEKGESQSSVLHRLQADLRKEALATTFKDGALLFLLKADLSEKEEETLNKVAFQYHLALLLSSPIQDLYRLSNLYNVLLALLDDLFQSYSMYRLYREERYRLVLPFVIERVEGLLDDNDNGRLGQGKTFGLSECLDENVQKVFRYDMENGTSLMDTVFVYLLHGRSLKEAARRQFVHKNTITYRLNLVSSLFGMDFEEGSQNLIYLQSIMQIYYLTGNLRKIFD